MLLDEIVAFFAAESALAIGEDGTVEVGSHFSVEVIVEAVSKQLLCAVDQDDIAEEFGFAGIAVIDQGVGEDDGGISLLDDDIAGGEDPLFVFNEGGIAVHEDAILVELHFAGQFLEHLTLLLDVRPGLGEVDGYGFFTAGLLSGGESRPAEQEGEE